ncbi:hypothetical protein NVP1121O_010 [Vibrio phage 1.121.O._10N.286.46.C4]|nr:hypothetical protein NVP1121O_010 [Vibrio phage 1.121.O._10N.286.46.C4]
MPIKFTSNPASSLSEEDRVNRFCPKLLVTFLEVDVVTGADLDTLASIPTKPLDMTDEELREKIKRGDYE